MNKKYLTCPYKVGDTVELSAQLPVQKLGIPPQKSSTQHYAVAGTRMTVCHLTETNHSDAQGAEVFLVSDKDPKAMWWVGLIYSEAVDSKNGVHIFEMIEPPYLKVI